MVKRNLTINSPSVVKLVNKYFDHSGIAVAGGPVERCPADIVLYVYVEIFMLNEKSEGVNVAFAGSTMQHGFHEYRFDRSRCLRCISQLVGPHDIVVEALPNTQTIEITNRDLVHCTAVTGFGSLQKPGTSWPRLGGSRKMSY